MQNMTLGRKAVVGWIAAIVALWVAGNFVHSLRHYAIGLTSLSVLIALGLAAVFVVQTILRQRTNNSNS